ncbi:hypothetical protein B0A55_09725 [Friedmanniomyces simplex]|uniref:O-methyltransferase C-terminal domain-containing protein n=1 Tax=Friedmanniomyces simplex TaxID=329884 RepID=A0A4U0WIE2_9PEZI|nr:hypothetical protein B0A55_09725 [Friedmanniomyces simplex]
MADAPALASQILSESLVVHAEITHSNPALSRAAEDRRQRVLGLIEKLKRLLQDPHQYLHEYVSTNWDHGAFYVVLEARVLETIAEEGSSAITTLSEKSGIPADKLLRILRLLSCQYIVEEVHDEVFGLTPVSQCLIDDEDFKAWVAFQWGDSMYDWHAQRPAKAERFRKAMRGVARSMDPADDLLVNWFRQRYSQIPFTVVEIGGRYGFASFTLAREFPSMMAKARGEGDLPQELRAAVRFEQRASNFDPQPVEDVGDTVAAYIVRNMLWNWSDDEVVELLHTFLPVMAKSPQTVVLVCDGASPARDSADPYIEQAFRRRDITMMTMHNARQRSTAEWQLLFARASKDLQVTFLAAPTWLVPNPG